MGEKRGKLTLAQLLNKQSKSKTLEECEKISQGQNEDNL